MKALYLNCSLKKSSEISNTSALMEKSMNHLKENGVAAEEIRIADFQVTPGMKPDMGGGDEWPSIFEKVKIADIVVIGTPIWLGEKSSIAKLVLERLYAASSETNEKGQSIYYNKVGGAIVTGNEDGGKAASRPILYSLQHIGFTVPPNADVYWVGDAGPGPSYIEGGQDNDFTIGNTKTMSYNLIHFAKLLNQHPIPAEGNLIES
ncbi:flavodoxin family protein [Metabacillus arenae]|uniref:Flavodoxin family protein n=1 Tax=Metabacillus arenae TaxID=2771434 RepID=A0A926NA25_9BACI|nr:flavodoxin family protein [Metabacillus arenae]MBD1379559.1 flavodoxin family protein [Metabacillus arenae]